MNEKALPAPASPSADCPRTRLSQGPLAAIDVCGCGMLQLHIGALTLRLTASALSELAETIEQGVAAHARRAELQRVHAHGFLNPNRGEA